jgi:hypothetical protein
VVDTDTFRTLRHDGRLLPVPSAKKAMSGSRASLSPSRVITLAIFARWSRFASVHDFYRYAYGRLRDAFPTLPTARSSTGSCATTWSYRGFRFALDGGHGSQRRHYEALDSSATSVWEAKRRGEGWLTGCADIGWSNRLGWYEGFRLLVAVNPVGVVTGFGFCAASSTDQHAAETFFAVRHPPEPASCRARGAPRRRDPT